jgi:hypothetical protein
MIHVKLGVDKIKTNIARGNLHMEIFQLYSYMHIFDHSATLCNSQALQPGKASYITHEPEA